jgi:hypothetical protein
MPYVFEFRPAKLFMEHKGVEIYHVYKDDDIDQGPRIHWFAVHDDGPDDNAHGTDGVFDVRCLPHPVCRPPSPISLLSSAANRAMNSGFASYEEWKNSAEYRRRQQLWHDWHETVETQAIKNTIRYAIEIGALTPNGAVTTNG